MKNFGSTYRPYGDNLPPGMLRFKHGGTGQGTIPEVINVLDGISGDKKAIPNGIGTLDENRYVPADQLDLSEWANTIVTLSTGHSGPYIELGEEVYFAILGFIEDFEYTVTCTRGEIARDGDTIIYTAPLDDPGPVTIKVNGSNYGYIVRNSNVDIPFAIATPTPNGVIFSGTPFKSRVAGKHDMSDWQIASDPTFLKIVDSTSNDKKNKTTWASNKLNPDVTYYVRVRYHDKIGGWSNWSRYGEFTCPNVVEFNGRTFFRHVSNMGTVMVWIDEDKYEHQTLIMDSVYRGVKPWSPDDGRTYSTSGTKYNNGAYYYTYARGATSPDSDEPYLVKYAPDMDIYPSFTDNEIVHSTGYFESKQSDSTSTTKMISTVGESNHYAAGFVRIRDANGSSCNLPSIQLLQRIQSSAYVLDSMDPTAVDYKSFALTRSTNGKDTNWTFDNPEYVSVDPDEPTPEYTIAWSSTEHSDSDAFVLDANGQAVNVSKTKVGLVIPTLDITDPVLLENFEWGN